MAVTARSFPWCVSGPGSGGLGTGIRADEGESSRNHGACFQSQGAPGEAGGVVLGGTDATHMVHALRDGEWR